MTPPTDPRSPSMPPASQHPSPHASTPADDIDAQVEQITASGPAGAYAVAGVATAIVVLLYVLFYFVVYLPRGNVQ